MPAVAGGPLDLRAVGDGGEIGVDVERDAEDSLELGLVPAGECASAIGRLHLRRGDDVLATVRVPVGAPVEPPQLVVEDAGELEFELGAAGGQRLRGVHDEPVGVFVQFPGGVLAVDDTAIDGQFGGVQDENVGLGVDLQPDA